MFSQSEQSWLTEVIQLASTDYISGMKNNADFLEQTETCYQTVGHLFKGGIDSSVNCYIPQLQNALYPDYNIRPVIGTNCLAAPAPRSRQATATFYRTIMPHAKRVVIFGHVFDSDMGSAGYIDCYNFIAPHHQKEKYIPHHETDEKPIYEISANYTVLEGALLFNRHFQSFRPADEKPVKSIVQLECIETGDSEKKIERSELSLTIIPVPSDLFDLATRSDEIKELFWQYFLISLKEPLVVTCTSGIGITGEFIFSLKLLEIFSTDHFSLPPAVAKNKIIDTLNQLRKTQPAFIWSKERFESSIRNAFVLLKYALENKKQFGEFAQVLDLSTALQWNIEDHNDPIVRFHSPHTTTPVFAFDDSFAAINDIFKKRLTRAENTKEKNDGEFHRYVNATYDTLCFLPRIGYETQSAIHQIQQLSKAYKSFLAKSLAEKNKLNRWAGELLQLLLQLQPHLPNSQYNFYSQKTYELLRSHTKYENLDPLEKQLNKLKEKLSSINFLCRSYEQASKKFKKGRTLNKELRDKLEYDPELNQYIRDQDVCAYDKLYVPQFKDNIFTEYNANVIPFNFAPAAGPRSDEDVAIFITSIVPYARYVVAIGDKLVHGKSESSGCFMDYMAPRNKSPNNTVEYVCKRPNQSYRILVTYPNGEDPLTTESHKGLRYSFEDKPVQSIVKVKCIDESKTEENIDEVEMKLVFLSLPDDSSFDLENSSDELKDIFLECYQKSLKELIAVHCYSGVGRTGHFILIELILQLLANNAIFSTTENAVSTIMLGLIDQIRQTRPGLIWTDDQFKMAILNAFVLYEYATEKGLTLSGQCFPVLKPTQTPDWRKHHWKSSFKPESMTSKPSVLPNTTYPEHSTNLFSPKGNVSSQMNKTPVQPSKSFGHT